jgi:hypothetical protein
MRRIKPWVTVPAAAIFSLSTVALAEAPASASVTVVGTYNVFGPDVPSGTTWTVNANGTVSDNFGNQGTWSSVRRSVEFQLDGCTFVGILHPLAINTKMAPGTYNCMGNRFTWWARLVGP